MSPIGTSAPVSSPSRACRRRASTAPRVWMPTSASASGSGFFSAISWAIRPSVRRRSSRSSTTSRVAAQTLAPSWPLWTGLKEPTAREPTACAETRPESASVAPDLIHSGECVNGRTPRLPAPRGDRGPPGRRAALRGRRRRELRARAGPGRRRPSCSCTASRELVPLPEDDPGRSPSRGCGRSRSTFPASASPTGPRASTTRGRASRAGSARRSTRWASTAAIWSSTTSAGRSGASGRCATRTGCCR